jgi:hypothetical protein
MSGDSIVGTDNKCGIITVLLLFPEDEATHAIKRR